MLDPLSDTGTFNGDDYTFDNNSSTHPSPLFDVTGIQASPLAPASVVLLRATVTNGVVGAFSIVNTITGITSTGANGLVQIADLNGGNGTIADTPVNTSIDTAPPQPNQYVYSAYQVNSLGTAGAAIRSVRRRDRRHHPAAGADGRQARPGERLGAVQYRRLYQRQQRPANNPPLVDVTGIEPHATVLLFRTDPTTQTTVQVGIISNANPTGPNNTVQVADVDGDGSAIADSPLGNPIDTISSGVPYVYSASQIDLAGNPSGVGKPVFGASGAVVIDGTDADNHGDNRGPGGTNELGWLYMQKVLNVIQPNITNGNKILVALGPDPSVGSSASAAAAIESAFIQSGLPAKGWTLEYVNGTANVQTYLSGGITPALTYGNASAGTITMAQTGLLYITTTGHAAGDLTNAELTVIDNIGGPAIQAYVNSGGGLYTQEESTVQGFGRGPGGGGGGGGGGGTTAIPYGWLSAVFPGLLANDAGNESPLGITITPAGLSAFSGNLTNADLTGGPWHDYFIGNLGALVVAATALVNDPTDPNNGLNEPLILTSAGTILGGNAGAFQVIIDSTPPVAPGLTLDPASDTGPQPGDGITQDNNGNPFPAPVFDATNIEPNGVVNLYRAPIINGVVGTPVLVNTFIQSPTAGPLTVQIADINNGNGTIPNGIYRYSVTDTDLAGNVSAAGTTNVTIDAGTPPPPSPLQLEAGSDTGFSQTDRVTEDNNGNPFPAPIFDVHGVIPNGTVELFRAPLINNVPGPAVLVNTVFSAAGGLVSIADTNNNSTIPNGSYFYTAVQESLSGDLSLPTAGLTVTIDSLPPQVDPPTAPVLELASDTSGGHNFTKDNNSSSTLPAPIFDAGTGNNPVEAGATVRLYRTQVIGGVAGTPVLVNTLTDTTGGLVKIADTNAGNGKIADGTYIYTLKLTSLAGVVGTSSQGLQVTIDATTPPTPGPFRLDSSTDTGTSNSDGITQITVGNIATFDVGPAAGQTGIPVQPGATVNLYRAPSSNGVPTAAAVLVNSTTSAAGGFVQIKEKSPLPADGTYIYTVQQVDQAGNASVIGNPINVTYDDHQPLTPATPVLDLSNPGSPLANPPVTSNTSPIIDVTLNLPGADANSSVSLIRDGSVVLTTPYNTTSGTLKLTDNGVSFGPHTYQAIVTDLAGNISSASGKLMINVANNAPGTLTLTSASDSGAKGDNITNVTSPTFTASSLTNNETLKLLRNGVIVASVPTGTTGSVQITDPGPLGSPSGPITYTYFTQQVDSHGNTSLPGPTLTLTVDTTRPAAPTTIQLNTNSDSGTKGDGITNVTNPSFDVGGVKPGGLVVLLRNGVVVTPAPVAASASGLVTLTDPGPVTGGTGTTYSYTAEQVSVAGTVSLPSSAASLRVITAKPAAPVLSLDPNSTVGASGSTTANTLIPTIDVAGVVAGNTLQLFRNGGSQPVVTKQNAAGNPVKLQDFGPLTNGTVYSYTAVQVDLAGNTSLVSTPLVVTINTAAVPTVPTTPTLTLDPGSDSGIKGDNITDVRQPFFDGHADPNVTVHLLNSNNQVVGTTVSNGAGIFTVQVNTSQVNGFATFQAQAINGQGLASAPMATPARIDFVTVAGDFTDSGKTTPALFRQTSASSLQWFVLFDASINGRAFGASSTDVPIIDDFDGDGKDDLVTFTPTTGNWTIESPSTNYTPHALATNFGTGINPTNGSAFYIPAPLDFTGSGKEVAAVYETTTGKWFIAGQPVITPITPFVPGMVPVPGNYDNTGKDELAVYNPSNFTWYISGPSGLHTVGFGGKGDIPEPGAYFATANSQAVTEAVWRPSTSSFLIRTPNGGTQIDKFQAGDIPAPGDYDGIGLTEAAVYRPSAGEFFVMGPNDATPRAVSPAGFGGAGFVPLLSPYPDRALRNSGGVISAFSIPASVNLASTALSFSNATSVISNGAVPGKAAVTPVTTSIRVRPNQAIMPMDLTTNAVETALSSLYANRSRRLFGSSS